MLKAYVENYGTESEKERFAAGALPEADLDNVIYRGIWAGLASFGTFHKRKRLSHEEVEEIAVMHRMADPGDKVTFEVIEPADEFDAQEWDTLKRLKLALTESVQVTPFWIIGHCGRKALKLAYARVELQIEGRPYKVEVCLK